MLAWTVLAIGINWSKSGLVLEKPPETYRCNLRLKSKFYESLETIRYAQSKVLANYGSEGPGFESLRAHLFKCLDISILIDPSLAFALVRHSWNETVTLII